jgi:ferredoxin
MSPDIEAVRKGCRGATLAGTAQQLCRAQLSQFKAAAQDPMPLTIGCTQETAVFSVMAEEIGRTAPLKFVNVRETAGWSSDAAAAGPKMAALIAAAGEPMPDIPWVKLESAGVILIYGSDEQAIEAGNLLKGHLDITVLLTPPAAIVPPRTNEFPVAKGRIRAAKGYLGAFEVTVDDFAQPAPSSRGVMVFGPSSNAAASRCDILLDLSGGSPLFTAPDLRDGYLRADPGNPAAVLSAVLKARDLVGTFDKPRYVTFRDDLCAHSRSKIVGCTRCLELCPAGAITPAGDHVRVDPNICAGCGQCAAACPTGAASYAFPPADALMRRLRTLLLTYREAGGQRPIVLLHDDSHGTPLIDALARFGDGLPANVLPVSVNEVTQVGLESIVAVMTYGATAIRFLVRARPRHDISGLVSTMDLAESLLTGL